MKVGVLALQGDFREHAEALSDLGAQPVEVRGPHDLASIDALVLPGGETTTVSLLLRSSGLLEGVRAAVAQRLPMLGTCAGMILLASEVTGGRANQVSLGAVDITVRRNGYGRQLDSFECALGVSGLAGGPFPAVFIRAPVVERVGPGVEVLAELPPETGVEGARRAVLCRQGAVMVAAFHPELSGDLRIHERFLTLSSS